MSNGLFFSSPYVGTQYMGQPPITVMAYGGATYVYYTSWHVAIPGAPPVVLPWIAGVKFVGLNASPAPVPPIEGYAAGGPVLFTLPNGSMAMLFAVVPSQSSSSVLLQM